MKKSTLIMRNTVLASLAVLIMGIAPASSLFATAGTLDAAGVQWQEVSLSEAPAPEAAEPAAIEESQPILPEPEILLPPGQIVRPEAQTPPGLDEVLSLLVNDDEVERQLQPLAGIWMNFLAKYEAENKTPERLALEEDLRRWALAADTSRDIDYTAANLPPVYPADYLSCYLGREKFTILLSSFDNLGYYQSLFDNPSLVEFKLASHSYLELFDITQRLNLELHGCLANVSGVLGRITITVFDLKISDADMAALLEGSETYVEYKDIIDAVREPFAELLVLQ